MNISAQNYPQTYKAFKSIELDNGGVTRWSPQPGCYPVPDHLINQLPVVEKQLLQLTDDELNEFCNGEQTEQEAVATEKGLHEASSFLNLFFNDWIEE